MKEARIEATIRDVTLVILHSGEWDAASETVVKAGIASMAYRQAASAAFKQLKPAQIDALSFDDKAKRLTEAVEKQGFKVVSAEPYTAPEAVESRKMAEAAYDKASASGKLDAVADLCGFDSKDAREIAVKAIHETLYAKKRKA